jgi:hypothetical protein
MTFQQMAKKWKDRPNGRRIAALMLLNSHKRMKVQKKGMGADGFTN